MTNVVGSAAIFVTEIERTGCERAGAVAVAFGFRERVVCIEADVAAEATAKRDDQLVLIEAAGRVVLEIVIRAEWTNATAGNQRIEGPG